MSSSLIERLNDLNSKSDACSFEELHSILEEALNLAEDAITEVVASELVLDLVL